MRHLIERRELLAATAFEESAAQAQYREAFQAEAASAPVAALDLNQLVEVLQAEPLIFAGSYHTAPEVPRALARLIERLPDSEGPEVLQLPIVRQDEGGAWLSELSAGNLDFDEFLEELEDVAPWPFERDAYKPLIEAGLARGMTLLGQGSPEAGSGPRSQSEADVAVLLAAGEASRRFVLTGEFHLASGHLPQIFLGQAGRDVSQAPRLVHSAWHSFLQYEAEGDAPAAARLESGMIALYAAAPYRLYESFTSWLHEAPEIPWPLRRPWRTPEEPDLEGILGRLADVIADRLEVDPSGLGECPWGAVATPELLDELVSLPLTEEGFSEVLGQLEHGRGYFLPSVPAMILPGASAGSICEEIVHAWNFGLSPVPDAALDARADLRTRILREAVGFYGSLAVVADRPHWTPEDETAPADTALGRAQKILREQLDTGLQFPEALAKELYTEDLETYLALAHLAGYLLGSGFPRDPETAAQVLSLPGDDLEIGWEQALIWATED